MLSKVDNIFNLKSKEIKFKPTQPRSKISGEFVNLFQLKYKCKHYDCFSRFFQKQFLGLHDL